MELEMYKGKPNTDNYELFYSAVLSLKDKDQCRGFFEDILTGSELDAISQRVQIGVMLTEKMTFADINAETGASSATITKVNQHLKHGSGVLSPVFDELKKEK